jgi:hypothetical protein
MPDQDDAQQQAADRQRAEQGEQAPARFTTGLAAAGQQEAERAQINQVPGYLASTQDAGDAAAPASGTPAAWSPGPGDITIEGVITSEGPFRFPAGPVILHPGDTLTVSRKTGTLAVSRVTAE